MTDVKPSAAVEMTLLTKERPLVSEMKAWLEDNLTRLPPDHVPMIAARQMSAAGTACASSTSRSNATKSAK